MFEIPIWEKYALSIEEAADYFGIGQKKIRKIVDENPTAEFVLKNGAFTKIKREKFEMFYKKYIKINKNRLFRCGKLCGSD